MTTQFGPGRIFVREQNMERAKEIIQEALKPSPLDNVEDGPEGDDEAEPEAEQDRRNGPRRSKPRFHQVSLTVAISNGFRRRLKFFPQGWSARADSSMSVVRAAFLMARSELKVVSASAP